jgi:hypothetical protein
MEEKRMVHVDPVVVVAAWQDAINRHDRAALLAVSDPRIEIIGPRGSAYGHAVLAEWLDRVGLRVEPRRVFARGTAVVVTQHAVWRAEGEVIGEAAIASRFLVDNRRVTLFARYDDLATALVDAGLTEDDEHAAGTTYCRIMGR